MPGHQLAAGRDDAGVEPLGFAAQQDVGRHGRAHARAPPGELGGIVDAEIAAHVLVGGPQRPLLRGCVLIEERLEPLGFGGMLHVAQVRAVDILHHKLGSVLDGHGEDGLALVQRYVQAEADVVRPAVLRGDAVPDERGAAPVLSDVHGRERLLLAVHGIVAPPGKWQQQAERKPRLGPVQHGPARFDGGQTDERAGVTCKLEPQRLVGKVDSIHSFAPRKVLRWRDRQSSVYPHRVVGFG